ncbi:MAG TPA: DUF494 family protein [Candidatus Hydrogenedentes bacterium]|jgi:uncharacterized protein Smg (DUF494 family)|nr:MAG: Protein Smg [Candidatus Hydrogenedentes bacterium ADurb.Bin170]HNZ48403.1 DUF494 family protein [Candidatus Hydrogenedentota bacterium]HOD94554.1 DUF494 family protein [Candidatus Hydrogenedentota bacterium]HOH41840.1 DUF494 family protein [Candidatus Hydrogenedentota bacterium]HOM48304.1 DUF494 family protein [Candidatus Hydrogenedentota bacterium]
MKNDVQNLVTIIMQRIAASNGAVSVGDVLRAELQKDGFKEKDINVAFEFVSSGMQGKMSFDLKFPARRHLNVFESFKIQEEVMETISKLEQMGLLDPMEREALLENIQHSDGRADKDDLEYALSVMLAPKRNSEAQNALLTVSEGYTPTFH